MSYINGNNIYGVRTINETPSKSCYTPTSKYEVKPEVVSEREAMEIQSYEKGEEVKQSSCSCNTQQNNNHKPDDCHKPDNCHKHDEWDCGSNINNCCKGETCIFDPSKSRCICAYMNILFEEAKAAGSTLFTGINTATTAYTTVTEYKPSDHCCTPCLVDATSAFTIDASKVDLKNFSYTGTTITVNDILVNGSPVLSVVTTPTGLQVTVNPSILDKDCTACDKGTNVALLLNALAPWTFIAEFDICGKVTTNGTTCKYKMTAQNVASIPGSITTPATFVASDVCLPNEDNSNPIVLDIRFDAFSQLISQNVTPVTNAAGTIVPVLTGNLMLNTSADIQVSKNTKVCFNAMI